MRFWMRENSCSMPSLAFFFSMAAVSRVWSSGSRFSASWRLKSRSGRSASCSGSSSSDSNSSSRSSSGMGPSGPTPHPPPGPPGPASRLLPYFDAVHHPPGHQVLQHPAEVLRGDAEHGGADADVGVERNHELVRVLLGQAVHQVNLGGPRPLGARRARGYLLDDAFGRA